MGRQASCRKLRGRRPGPGLRRPDAGEDQPGGDPFVPRVDAKVRGHAQPRPLVRADRHREAGRAAAGPDVGEGSAGVRAQHRQDAREGQHEGVRQAHHARRRRAAHRRRPAGDRAGRGPRRRSGSSTQRLPARRDALLPAHAGGRPQEAARALPLRPRSPEGGRCRQRRHARVHLPDDGPRQRGSAVPPVQGGAAIGARAVPRQERVRKPRPARRGRAATHPGRQRHSARLDP